MPDGVDDYVKMAKLVAEVERTELRDAFNNSMAGRETGRMDVAFVGEAARTIEAEKRRRRLANLTFETALQTLLTDPVYRKRWEEFGTFLETYSNAAQAALARAIEASEAAQAAVQQALENANMLDGKAVFETDDGRYVYADGTEIEPARADQIVPGGDVISYAKYQQRVQAAQEADDAVAEIRRYQKDLTATEERRTNPDNPYKTPQDMDAEQKRLEETAPDKVREQLPKTDVEIESRAVPAGRLNLGASN